jgi:hypothetical protein
MLEAGASPTFGDPVKLLKKVFRNPIGLLKVGFNKE